MSDLTTNQRPLELASFVEQEALPGTGVDPAAF